MKDILFSISLLSILFFANINFAESNSSSLELIAAGDIFPSPSILSSGLKKDGARDYLPYYEFVKETIKNADISVAWFGGPVAGEGEKFSGYPLYNNPPEFVKAAIDAGFDVFFHTNHLLDQGIKGLVRTIKYFKSLGSVYLGAYLSMEESRKIYYIEKKGIRLAFLSYLYGANVPIKVKNWMINYIDIRKIKRDIKQAMEERSDFIIVALHWGREYERFPSKEQRIMAREIATAGADLILGSHPHVIQPAESITITSSKGQIKKVFVIYSFGNFLSSQRNRYSDCGLMARFRIEKNEDVTILKKASYIPTWVKWSFNRKSNRYSIKILPTWKTKKSFLDGNSYLISKEEYNKMLLSWNDTILHLDNPSIPFMHEEE